MTTKDTGGSALNVERARHWRTCQACGGDGRIAFNLHDGDPQWDDDEDCDACHDGEVTVWVDPLVVMRACRRVGWFHPGYRKSRAAAMTRSLHYHAQREMDLCLVRLYGELLVAEAA